MGYSFLSNNWVNWEIGSQLVAQNKKNWLSWYWLEQLKLKTSFPAWRTVRSTIVTSPNLTSNLVRLLFIGSHALSWPIGWTKIISQSMGFPCWLSKYPNSCWIWVHAPLWLTIFHLTSSIFQLKDVGGRGPTRPPAKHIFFWFLRKRVKLAPCMAGFRWSHTRAMRLKA